MARAKLRALRFWERAWAKYKADYAPSDVVLVVARGDLSAQKRVSIELSLAFAGTPMKAEFTQPVKDTNALLEAIVENQARQVLYIGIETTAGQRRALRFMGTRVARLEEDELMSATPVEMVERQTGIKKLVDLRMSIYFHASNQAQLLAMTRAFAETKRQYPDLVLLVTGVDDAKMASLEHGLIVSNISASKERIQLSDIIYDEVTTWQDEWAQAANVCVLSGERKDYANYMSQALQSGAAAIVFGEPERPDLLHIKLEKIGAIWSVGRPQNLAAALSQALEPEKAAITVMQSMDFLVNENRDFYDNIDELLTEAS